MGSQERFLSVLIPAHNGAHWIAETLKRLPAAAGRLTFEAIVVDNSSSDETVSLCRAAPDVRMISNDSNRGFSSAVNQAGAVARGSTLFVINQDLYLAPLALEKIHAFLEENDSVVGGRLVFPDGRPQMSCGPFPTLIGSVFRMMLPHGQRKYHSTLPDSANTVDWATGAFLGFRKSLFERIGGFDEDFFMYYEDVDFCLRARRAGFPTYYLPTAKAVHANPHGARKRDEVPVWLQKEIRRSQMTYFRKHRSAWESAAINALNRAYFTYRGWPWKPL